MRFPLSQPALQTGHLQCRLKTPREKLAPLMNCARIRFAQEASVRQHRCGGDGEQRSEALFVLAAVVWCPRKACEHLGMHARMNTSLTIRHGRHARLMCSQAAGRQWSSQTMNIDGWTSRGQLHLIELHAVVQWFASVCCVCRPRAIARSTSHNACAARVMRG